MGNEPTIISSRKIGNEQHIVIEPCQEVCSREIDIAIKDGMIEKAEFCGGCSGNTQGVCALLRGMKVEEAISRLRGIRCRTKSTSCPDQLAQGLSKNTSAAATRR